MRTNIQRAALHFSFLIFSMLPGIMHGQDLTTSGYRKDWTGELTVERDTILNGKHKLGGWSIPVLECDASKALALWKGEYKAISTSISGSDPVKAVDARVPGLGDAPLLVLAKATKGGKKLPTRLTLAFCTNDSTSAQAMANVDGIMNKLAVELNRAVIKEQITEQQKVVDRYSGKLADAQKDGDKAQQRTADANAELEKVKKNKSKLGADQAEQQADVQKYQQRYTTTQEAKDLDKLTKAQEKLLKTQKKMSKELKNEAGAQKGVNKRQGDVPEAQKDQNKYQTEKEAATTDLEALKRKLEAVR